LFPTTTSPLFRLCSIIGLTVAQLFAANVSWSGTPINTIGGPEKQLSRGPKLAKYGDQILLGKNVMTRSQFSEAICNKRFPLDAFGREMCKEEIMASRTNDDTYIRGYNQDLGAEYATRSGGNWGNQGVFGRDLQVQFGKNGWELNGVEVSAIDVSNLLIARGNPEISEKVLSSTTYFHLGSGIEKVSMFTAIGAIVIAPIVLVVQVASVSSNLGEPMKPVGLVLLTSTLLGLGVGWPLESYGHRQILSSIEEMNLDKNNLDIGPPDEI